MSDFFNSIPLTRIASTIAKMTGIAPPAQAEPDIDWLTKLCRDRAAGDIDRVFMYHSDAIPMYIYQEHTHLFAPIFPYVQIAIPFLSSVMSVTPAAFASMYTGAPPAVHGIREYVRPRLETDTLYDAMARHGKKSAIIAMPDSSFLHIFSGRDIPCFVVKNVEEALKISHKLIDEDQFDLISCHVFEYDDNAHAYGPRSQQALDAVAREADVFNKIGARIKEKWTDHAVFLGYGPDHGQHAEEDGRGSHGSELPEDMNIMHFYGVFPRG